MAKQLVNPIEQHVEKIVVGVGALALIASVAMYLSSPNKIELDGDVVTPGTIESKLAQRAASVRRIILEAPDDADPVEPLYQDFVGELDAFRRAGISDTLPGAVAFGPSIPKIDLLNKAPNQAYLAKVLPAKQPKATSGRSTIAENFQVTNWVTLSAIVDVKEQMAEQQKALGGAHKEVIFGPVQLQRREQRPDGGWSDSDWTDIKPWPAAQPPPPPPITFIEVDGALTVPNEVRDATDRFVKDLSAPRMQLDLVRPLMPEFANGDAWSFPIITNRRDVLEQDDYYLHPGSEPAGNPDDRYGEIESDTGLQLGTAQELSVSERIKEHNRRYDEFMARARQNDSDDDARRAFNEMAEIIQDIQAGASDKEKAKRRADEAEQLENDILRLKRSGRVRRPTVTQGGANQPAERKPPPTAQIWAHDARPGSVASGRAYQYRIRPTMLNRLLAEPEKFRKKADASEVFLVGEWSKPVTVLMPPDTVLFATSKTERKGTVGFEFYKWFEGVWVKSARRFKFGVGDRLRGESRAPVPSTVEPGSVENALVEFALDATVVDIDFERTYRERKRGAGRGGVKFASASKAAAVVFVDGAGRLHERFVPSDKADPTRKTYAERVFRPK